MKRIEVIVSPTGESRVETFGFAGEACRTATKKLIRALGATQTETTKPEFYTNQSSRIVQKENE